MTSLDRLKYLKGNLVEVLKKSLRLEADIARYKVEKHFYRSKLDLIEENLALLRSGNYIVSINEYKLIIRDLAYNRANYCDTVLDLAKSETKLEQLKNQSLHLEIEIDFLIKDINIGAVVIPFKRQK